VAGPNGRHDPARVAVRHGHERGSVTLGGRRVQVSRPRVRAVDGSGEVAIPSYELFSSIEILGRMALEKMLAGLSTRVTRSGLSRSVRRRTKSPLRQVSPRFRASLWR
jgi:hypothetical protein